MNDSEPKGKGVPAVILNVDDHAPGRYARTRFLSRAGFIVREAANGTDALAVVAAEKPDLILLDINLPDMNGFEVCRHIRSAEESERTPIILMSASRLAEADVVFGLEAGGDNYLREPIEPAVLVASVKALLRAREAEEALAQSNEQLLRFAFVVSHELQEPVRMIKSYAQLLERKCDAELSEEAKDYVQFVIDGVDRMEKFIRDMLTYSQSVEVALELKEAPARVALDMAVLELDAAIRDAGACVQSEPLPVVEADMMRLAQVFRNLIGNAIKYRSEAPPMIRVSAVQENGYYVFTVEDNGIGIDPKYADSIFHLFKRLHPREKSGSGVGLAVCKEVVERHGGRIWVDPSASGGSAFRFTLPKPD
jgi:signal transduction histidine kinase